MLSSFSERSSALELIDLPIDSEAELRESFRYIEFANRFFGGIGAVKSGLRGLKAQTVLDVASGIADIPAALSRSLRITCLDNNGLLVAFARDRYAGNPNMSFVVGNATTLPFADRSFDVAMCNLALHHFDPPSAIALLSELRRVSRISPLVTDLQRSFVTYASTYVFTRFSRNRLTRHDGPLSARRAYTPAEALRLARQAGWHAPSVKTHGLIRMVLRDETGG
jgi:ubiquinone/menaquinone biosynthesis C-methylase UbiE